MKIVIAVIVASLVFSAVSFGITLGLLNLLLQFGTAAAEAPSKADYLAKAVDSTLVLAVSNGLAAVAAGYIFPWIGKPRSFLAPLLFGIALAAGYVMSSLSPAHGLVLGATVLAGALLGSYLYVPVESGLEP